MFWMQLEDNSFNDILTKEDVTLNEILDHESLLQECRSQNENLIKLFNENSNFEKLLKYVLLTPDEEFSENIRFKYSSISCEVLTSDIPSINIRLTKGAEFSVSGDYDRPYFNQFIDILCGQDNINPLTMSFCIKILQNILKFDNEFVMKLIIAKSDCMDILLSHIDSDAIVHFFNEFVQCEDDVAKIRNQWLADQKFVLKLAKLLGISESKNHSIQLIFSNMSLGIVNRIISSELISQLNEQEFLNIVFTYISNLTSESSLISTCVKIIRIVIDIEVQRKEKSSFCLQLIEQKFNLFVELLNKPPKQIYESMPTTVGILRPYGPTRIEIVNLIESLLKFEKSEINLVIVENKIFDVLLTHVIEYQWNTQFHLSLLRIIEIVLSDLSFGNKFYCFQKHLIQDIHIYSWYFQLHSNLESLQPRPGYSGLVWRVGNLLNCLKNSELSPYLLTMDNDIMEKWPGIVNNYLNPKNTVSEKSQLKIDNGLKELDLDLNIVDIDEAYLETPDNNMDAISDFFRNTSDNLDDMFPSSLMDNSDEDWVVNELEMPSVPVDDYVSNLKPDMDSDGSTSSDEESPVVVRQKHQGRAAKYISSDFCTNSSIDFNELDNVPESDENEYFSLEFNDDPWDKKNTDTSVHNEWAKF